MLFEVNDITYVWQTGSGTTTSPQEASLSVVPSTSLAIAFHPSPMASYHFEYLFLQSPFHTLQKREGGRIIMSTCNAKDTRSYSDRRLAWRVERWLRPESRREFEHTLAYRHRSALRIKIPMRYHKYLRGKAAKPKPNGEIKHKSAIIPHRKTYKQEIRRHKTDVANLNWIQKTNTTDTTTAAAAAAVEFMETQVMDGRNI